MSLLLKSIELSNIRSHEHFIFEPAEEGLTAISGPTGSGKSTIVDSLAWTLFGTKPKGVSKNSAIAREGMDFKEDRCFSRIEIYLGEDLLKVERKMISKGGAAACNVWQWDGDQEEWTHMAGESVSHAEAYIRKRLKMDEKGFLTSVLVQQKQVDQLISAGPPERARVIEKLTGISAISAGIVAARQEQNSIKKATQLSNVDESEYAAVKASLAKEKESLNALKERYGKAQVKIKEAKEKLSSQEDRLELEEANFSETSEARRELESLEVKIESLESILEEAIEEKNELRGKVPQGAQGGDFEESTRKINALRRNLAEHKAASKSNERQTAISRKSLEELQKNLSALPEVDSAITIESLEEKQKELEAVEKDSYSAAKKLDGKITQLESAIEVVSHGDNCPTCLQKVEDVKAAVQSLEASLEGYRSTKNSHLEDSEKASKKILKIREQIKNLNARSDYEEAIRDTESELEGLVSTLREISSSVKKEEVELKALEKIHRGLEAEESNRRLYAASLKRVQKTIEDIEKLKAKRANAEALVTNSKALSESKLNSFRKKTYELRNRYQAMVVAISEIKSDARLLNQSIKHLDEKKTLLKRELKKHKDLLKSLETSTLTLETLTEFRANRVKTVLPAIEATASELLSRFTDGKFIGLKLDEKFNASVVLSSGVERPVGLLSGGELSAASIALRLAISTMLNGPDGRGLIILDEVLVSQDADRSDLILSTIGDVCEGQVVLIAHGEGVTAIADKKVEMATS